MLCFAVLCLARLCFLALSLRESACLSARPLDTRTHASRPIRPSVRLSVNPSASQAGQRTLTPSFARYHHHPPFTHAHHHHLCHFDHHHLHSPVHLRVSIPSRTDTFDIQNRISTTHSSASDINLSSTSSYPPLRIRLDRNHFLLT